MTREQASKLWPIMKAYSEGKEVQYYDAGFDDWNPATCPSFDQFKLYRIKPEAPKLRPWHQFEVPVCALVREILSTNSYLIIGSSPHNFMIGNQVIFYDQAVRTMEHSVDGGKTWLPCGVYES